MDFKSFLPKKDEKNTYEYFWSLIIEPGWVQAGIWRIERDEAQVNFSGMPVAWGSDEDLITSADSALSASVQNLPDETPEPTKTVFGVVSSWVEGGQIKADYLDKIKIICTELSLKPVGFVVISEAVAHFVKSEEGSPLSAIIVGVYKENIELSVFQLGNLLGTTKISRSVSIVDDITEGLTRFSGSNNLPSRFIMYDGREGELEEARQALLKANWEDHSNLKFLHTPKVEVVETKDKLKAVCLAGASEMSAVERVTDVGESKKDDLSSEKPDVAPSAESFGFTINKDLSQTIEQAPLEDEQISEPDDSHSNVEPVHNFTEEIRKDIPRPVKTKRFNFLGGVFKNLSAKFGNFFKNFKGLSFGKIPLIAGLVVLLLVIIGGVAAWWFLPTATVTVYVSPKTLNESFEAKFDASGETKPQEKIIKANLEKTTIEGSKTASTTGIKTVGDKAKGQVTIYRAGTSMSLPSGTIIKGPDSLSFSLDEAVTIASGSAGSPGSTKANVSAASIGASYNLSSGTSFSVGSYSLGDLEAKNESAFSGGSSREVNVVSDDDMEKLEKDLTDELKDKAIKELSEKISDDEVLIDASLVSGTESKKFNSKIGDEASTLKLDLSVNEEAFVVKKSDLEDVSMEFLKEKTPPGFILKRENIKTNIETVGGGEEGKYRVSVTANLLPDVDIVDITKKILGRYPEVAKQYMSKNVAGFTGVEFDQKPTLPGRLGTLPRVYGHLEVLLAAQK